MSGDNVDKETQSPDGDEGEYNPATYVGRFLALDESFDEQRGVRQDERNAPIRVNPRIVFH